MNVDVSGAYSNPVNSTSQAAGLEAQIARYQKQLSDCVNCDSSKTHKGQADIQALAAKISEAKARLEAIVAHKSEDSNLKRVDHSHELSGAGANGRMDGAASSAPTSPQRLSNLGSVIDLYA